MRAKSPGHGIVVVGASAGGLEALRVLLGGLAVDLPAAIFIVMHIGPSSHLVHILGQMGPLPVSRGESGESFSQGHVYVAGPDRHLLLHNRHILLSRGPRENMSRPAIDPLFRSAAASFGAQAIGIVLSGHLSDGTAGLTAIKRCGGVTIVQDPASALVPEMPESALRRVDVDHVVDIADMAKLVAGLVRVPAGPSPTVPLDIRLEAAIAAQERAGMEVEDRLGALSPFTCPECGGALWEIDDRSMLRFRCHVGHAFGSEELAAAQADEIEKTLEKLQRAYRENAALARRMASGEQRRHSLTLTHQFERRALEYEGDAELIERLLSNSRRLRPSAAAEDQGSAGDNAEEQA